MGLRHVDRLRARVDELVGTDDHVLAAFQVQSGSSPGTEGLLFPLGIFAILGAARARRYYTVAVTQGRVLLIRNRGESRPVKLEKRLDRNSGLGPIRGRGDYRIEIDGDQFWVPLRWLDEARRAERLARPPTASEGRAN